MDTSTQVYCITCSEILESKINHERSHQKIPLKDYHEALLRAQKTKKEELLRGERVLEHVSLDLEALKELIKHKQKQIDDTFNGLNVLISKIAEEEKALLEMQHTCNALMSKVEEEKEVENLESFDPNKAAISVIKFKESFKKITNDVNIQNMAEAVIISYIIENQKIQLELISKRKKVPEMFKEIKEALPKIIADQQLLNKKLTNLLVSEPKERAINESQVNETLKDINATMEMIKEKWKLTEENRMVSEELKDTNNRKLKDIISTVNEEWEIINKNTEVILNNKELNDQVLALKDKMNILYSSIQDTKTIERCQICKQETDQSCTICKKKWCSICERNTSKEGKICNNCLPS